MTELYGAPNANRAQSVTSKNATLACANEESYAISATTITWHQRTAGILAISATESACPESVFRATYEPTSAEHEEEAPSSSHPMDLHKQ